MAGECSGQDRLKTSEPSARDQNCPGRSLGWCLSLSKNVKNHKEKSRRILGLDPTQASGSGSSLAPAPPLPCLLPQPTWERGISRASTREPFGSWTPTLLRRQEALAPCTGCSAASRRKAVLATNFFTYTRGKGPGEGVGQSCRGAKEASLPHSPVELWKQRPSYQWGPSRKQRLEPKA